VSVPVPYPVLEPIICLGQRYSRLLRVDSRYCGRIPPLSHVDRVVEGVALERQAAAADMQRVGWMLPPKRASC